MRLVCPSPSLTSDICVRVFVAGWSGAAGERASGADGEVSDPRLPGHRPRGELWTCRQQSVAPSLCCLTCRLRPSERTMLRRYFSVAAALLLVLTLRQIASLDPAA